MNETAEIRLSYDTPLHAQKAPSTPVPADPANVASNDAVEAQKQKLKHAASVDALAQSMLDSAMGG